MDKGGIALAAILGLGIGMTTLIFTMTRARATLPEPETEFILTTEDLSLANSIAELNAYYNLIGELYITKNITIEKYQTFYDAYYNRWHELTEV